MEAKIEELLDDIRPFLNMEGGDVSLIKCENNYVYIRLTGACANCGYQDITIKENIEAYLKENIPEIKEVINIEL